MEDWYKVTSKDLVRNFGTGILQQFNRSHIKLITSVYSDYTWLPWKFNNVPVNYFKDKQNVALYLNWLGNKLGFTKMEDWYNISYQVSFFQNFLSEFVDQRFAEKYFPPKFL